MDGESIYSPETSDIREIALARRYRTLLPPGPTESNLAFSQFDNEIVVPFVKRMQEERQALENEKRKLEDEKRNVRRQDAENWRNKNLMRGNEAKIEEDKAEIEALKGVLVKRTQELELEEGMRRRNRFVLWKEGHWTSETHD